WAVVLATLAARAWLFERNEQWFEATTIPLTIAGLVLALGGWGLLRWALPGLVYLAFMFPLPPSVNAFLANPLQRLATWGSLSLLQSLGLPALAQGNVLIIGPHQLFVEQACNGLSMLMTFVALVTAVALLTDRPIWEKGVLLASAVPIALVSNILRITI